MRRARAVALDPRRWGDRACAPAYASATTAVAAPVTGSPESACSANATASAAARRTERACLSRSVVHITQGRAATHHARLGVLSIETVTPASVNDVAPSAADEAGLPARSRNRYMPSAANGSGSATHRLKDTTSDGRSRIASVIGIKI